MPRRIDRYQNRQIRNIKKDIHRMKFNEETKYHEIYLANQAAVATGSLNIVSAMAQGDTQVNREGVQCRATSLRLRLCMSTLNAAAVDTAVIFRVIVFWDNAANGVVPAVSGDPVAGTTALLNDRTTTDLVYSPRQIENAWRFDIVYDKIHVMNPNFLSTNPYPLEKVISKVFKFNRILQFDSNAATVAATNKNALYVLVIAQNASEATFDLSTTLYFKEN